MYETYSGKQTNDLTLRGPAKRGKVVVRLNVDHHQFDLEVIPKGTEAVSQGRSSQGLLVFIGNQRDPIVRVLKPGTWTVVRRI